MANPSPFSPVSYDTADWINQITVVDQTIVPSGGVQASGSSINSVAGITTGGNVAFGGPADGKQHTLLWLTFSLSLNAVSCTTPVTFQIRARDFTNTYWYGVAAFHVDGAGSAVGTAVTNFSTVFYGGQTFPPGSGGPGINFTLDRIVASGGTLSSSDVNLTYGFAWT